jgi:hypothetical protein
MRAPLAAKAHWNRRRTPGAKFKVDITIKDARLAD